MRADANLEMGENDWPCAPPVDKQAFTVLKLMHNSIEYHAEQIDLQSLIIGIWSTGAVSLTQRTVSSPVLGAVDSTQCTEMGGQGGQPLLTNSP